MDRREFLKLIGLSGVALTLPKPLQVVAARMADLERLPLHVGYVETMPAKPCGNRGFYLLHEIGVRVERAITSQRHEDYYEKWSIAMFLRKEGDKTCGIKQLQIPAHAMPNPENKFMTFDEDGKPRFVAHFQTVPHAFMLQPDDLIEFWFVPGNARDPERMPKYPLPKLEVVLRGVRHYADPNVSGGLPKTRAMVFWNLCEVKKVLLDRAKAIELGLCATSEPEGLIA